MPQPNPEHIPLLEDSLRAPSAHNAQPWQIKPLSDGATYELHYDQHQGLPHDRDNKDAYLTMGAFVETMVLTAPAHDLEVAVTPELTRDGQDLFIARVAIQGATAHEPIDPLSLWVDLRATNRNEYNKKRPLPAQLENKLTDLGNVLVDTDALKDVVLDASVKSWADKQFVHDLQAWLRKDTTAEDGLTAEAMNLSAIELHILNVVFRVGRVTPPFLGKLLSSGEVDMFSSAPKAAVLASPSMEPSDLFEAGRRLLRSWVTIESAGFSYQPYSVAVDEASSIPRVADIAGVDFPVALYRVGRATKQPQVVSNRKPLADVLID